MRNLLNPKWLFIVNTLPTVLLFVVLFGQFNIIKTLLDESSIRYWTAFGLILAFLVVANFAYAIYLVIRKNSVPMVYAAVALLCYIPFIYLHAFHSDKIVPFSVPEWMVSDNIQLYVGTFLMPTLAYALFILVAHFTPENKEHSAWVNFVWATSVPVIGYVFSQIILPMWKPIGGEFNVHTLLVLTIVATLVFLFFVVRGIFILASKKGAVFKKYQLAWKIPIAIILPLLGLAVNSG